MNVISASFTDPYALILCDDSSIRLLQANKSGEIEEIERSDALLANKWLSGCMYKGAVTGDKPLAFLLSAEGGLHVSSVAAIDRCTQLMAE